MEGLTIEEISNSNSNSNSNSISNSNQLCFLEDESEHTLVDYEHPNPYKRIKGKCSQKVMNHFNEKINNHSEDLSKCRRNNSKTIKRHRELHKDNIEEHQTYIKLYYDLFTTTYILVVLVALGLAYKYTTRIKVDNKLIHYLASLLFSPFYIMFYIFKTN